MNLRIKMYKTIILHGVLYGCKIWLLALRREHRLRASENRVLRRIFGPKREEVAGGWRRLHNEELHNFYAPSKSRKMILAGHVARMGDEKCTQYFGQKT
jgi:hypothetical protein